MAGWKGKSPNVDSAFQASFKGIVSNDSVYSHPYNKYKNQKLKQVRKKANKEVRQYAQKVLEAGSPTYPAGSLPTLYPTHLDPQFVDLTRKETPVVEMIPRKAVRGSAYNFNQITSLGSGKWKPERAPKHDRSDTESRQVVPIKYGYADGAVTGQAMAAMRGFKDALGYELEKAQKALRYLQENTIINGNTSGTYSESTPYNGPHAYDGLRQSITTNTNDLSGSAVTIQDFRDQKDNIYNNGGKLRTVITDAGTHSYFKGLLQDFQRHVEPVTDDLQFGIPDGFSIDGVNFIKSRFMPTSSGSREMIGLTPDAVEMAVLQDVTFEELARTVDEQPFQLKVYEALAMKAEQWCFKITGIL